MSNFLFTSESVGPGHPDRICDQIASAILDEYLIHDKYSKVAIEVSIKDNFIFVFGEVTSNYVMNEEKIKALVVIIVRKIGYSEDYSFDDTDAIKCNNLNIVVKISNQSSDIASGIEYKNTDIGAGDQGIMFGFATNEINNTLLLPLTYFMSKKLSIAAYQLALKTKKFGIDLKSQITVDYENYDNFLQGKPQKLNSVVLSIPVLRNSAIYEANNAIIEIQNFIKDVINTFLIQYNIKLDISNYKIYINPTGVYHTHSSIGDAGTTNRKIVVDQYGGHGYIGGGGLFGKDPTKVDVSAAIAARWLARKCVQLGLSNKINVQLSYAIGITEPLSISIYDNKHSYNIEEVFKKLNLNFNDKPFSPKWIIEKFHLRELQNINLSYFKLVQYGIISDIENLPWEK